MAEASAPAPLASPQVTTAGGVKVMTYNLQGNVLTDVTERNYTRRMSKLNGMVASIIEVDADVVLLQEVDSGESQGGLNSVEAIRNQLVLSTGEEWFRKYVVKCTEVDKPGEVDVERRLAILSTAPITNTARWHSGAKSSKWVRGDSRSKCPIDQKTSGYPRAAISAQTHGLRVTSVHLAPGDSYEAERSKDISYLLKQDGIIGKGSFAAPRGFVFGGDFNSEYADIKSVLTYRDGRKTRPLTWISQGTGTTKNPDNGRRIDHIFSSANLRRVGAVQVVAGEYVYDPAGNGDYPSDHRAVAAAVTN